MACGIVLAGCLVGCSGPRLTVVHTLPAAVPLPPGGEVRSGRFEVDGPGSDWIPGFLQAEVARRTAGLRGTAGSGESLKMGGTATVRVTDDSGTRAARRRGDAGELAAIELPYLVRTVDVRVVFAVAPAGGGREVELETRRTYASNRDPAVRGKHGLWRGDDPERVPPADEVTRELLAECVDAARGMLAPVEMPVTLQFRYAGGARAQAGLAAVGKGDYAEAVEQLRPAVEDDPDNPALLYNLAAACEAAGRLGEAEQRYRAALAASGGEDVEARSGAERAAKLRRRMASPEQEAASQ
jgi:hypothetical protein